MAGPFTLRWTVTADQQYRQLQQRAESGRAARGRSRKAKSSQDEGLFKQVQKTVAYLQADPRHPGLRTHEYRSLVHPFDRIGKVFEAYAQNRTPGAYRIFWCYGPESGELTIIAITPHP